MLVATSRFQKTSVAGSEMTIQAHSLAIPLGSFFV